MKTLLFLTLGALLASPLLANAQSTNDAPPGPPPEGGPGGEGHHHGPDFSFLTADQKAEFEKDRKAALDANPSLGTQIQAAHEQFKQDREDGTKPTDAQFQQMKSLQDQLDAAIVSIDPAAASIIAEIKAHHPHHGPGGPGGPEGGQGSTPPPADSGT